MPTHFSLFFPELRGGGGGGDPINLTFPFFPPCFYPGCLWLQAYTLFITFIAPLRLRRHFQKQVCVCVLQKGLTL